MLSSEEKPAASREALAASACSRLGKAPPPTREGPLREGGGAPDTGRYHLLRSPVVLEPRAGRAAGPDGQRGDHRAEEPGKGDGGDAAHHDRGLQSEHRNSAALLSVGTTREQREHSRLSRPRKRSAFRSTSSMR